MSININVTFCTTFFLVVGVCAIFSQDVEPSLKLVCGVAVRRLHALDLMFFQRLYILLCDTPPFLVFGYGFGFLFHCSCLFLLSTEI